MRCRKDLGHLRLFFMAGNAVTALPPGTFAGLANLTGLFIRDNAITALVPGVLSGMPSFTDLDIYNNKITALDSGVFDGVPILNYVDVGFNHIGSLAAGAFRGLRRLRRLSLHHNRLLKLQPGLFGGLVALQQVDLGSNYIQSLPDGLLAGAPNLQQLWMSFNPSLAAAGRRLTAGVVAGGGAQLRQLRMNSCNLTAFEQRPLQNMSRLEELDLRFNRLAHLDPAEFSALLALAELMLTGNALTTVPPGLFDATGMLESIKLDGNKITTLEAGAFRGLVRAETLWLQRNSITTVAMGAFPGLVRLRNLVLYHNLISHLPTGIFSDATSLETLVLSENQLTDIGGAVKNLGRLAVLSASYNRLANFSSGVFGTNPALVYISVAHNPIGAGLAKDISFPRGVVNLNLASTELTKLPPKALHGLSHLLKLSLGSHKLTSVEAGCFGGLLSLQTLDLAKGLLVSLPVGLFVDAQSLLDLDLSFNDITELVAGVFKGLGSLLRLHLRGNHIAAMQPLTFLGTFSLTEVNLDGNRLACLRPGTFAAQADDTAKLDSLGAACGAAANNNNIDVNIACADSWRKLTTLNLANNLLVLGSLCQQEAASTHPPFALAGGVLARGGVFSGLTTVANLILAGNKITVVSSSDFGELLISNSIDLQDNSIAVVDPDLVMMQLAPEVKLRNNRLTKLLAKDTYRWFSMKYLGCAYNSFSSLSEETFGVVTAGRSSDLRELNFDANKITEISTTLFAKLTQLETLLLRNNVLTQIAEPVFGRIPLLRVRATPGCLCSCLCRWRLGVWWRWDHRAWYGLWHGVWRSVQQQTLHARFQPSANPPRTHVSKRISLTKMHFCVCSN